MERIAPAYARTAGPAQSPALSGNVVDLVIAETQLRVGSRVATAMTINGTVPGPLVRLREGEDARLNVTNCLKETSSLHWHGVLVPPGMDGVPGVSFAGIEPGTTFTYRFPIKQSGTSRLQRTPYSPDRENIGPSEIRRSLARNPALYYGFVTCQGLNYMRLLVLSPRQMLYFYEGGEVFTLYRAE